MVEVPAFTPVTTPAPLIVAIVVVTLLHTPPPVASVSVVVAPWHTLAGPRITATDGSTVTTILTVQPVGSV